MLSNVGGLCLNQAMKLYKVWVSFTEDDLDAETRAIEVRREAEVDHADVPIEVPPASTNGATGSERPTPKPKGEPKPKKEKSAVQQAKQARACNYG